MINIPKKDKPLVTVLISTYNRPRYLREAVESVLRQRYSNFELIVVNDGGEDVSGIINSFSDGRIKFINRRENKGLAYSLNEALVESRGQYVTYLGDDDLYYPNHIEKLVSALENNPDFGAAYSDLYKVYCQFMPDGSRQVLSKVVEISRDFDKLFMLYFNHALHVSLMHRRDLIEKTGYYNENIKVMIDWDMTRRLVFFTDFYHINDITGEFYAPVKNSDRISVVQRKNKQSYAKNIFAIRTTRPAKPWTNMKDLSIIFVSDKFDQQSGETIGKIWRHTFYPYLLYLPMHSNDIRRLDTDMPNIIKVPMQSKETIEQQIDAALKQCEGEYIAIVPSGFEVGDAWVEEPLFALQKSKADNEAILLEEADENNFAAVFRKDELSWARQEFGEMNLGRSLEAAGMTLRKLKPEEVPFKFDILYNEAQQEYENGNYSLSAEIYEHIANTYGNSIWMQQLAADAHVRNGNTAKAIELISHINQQRPTVDTLLLESRIYKKQKRFNDAINTLKKAEQILEGSELLWT